MFEETIHRNDYPSANFVVLCQMIMNDCRIFKALATSQTVIMTFVRSVSVVDGR